MSAPRGMRVLADISQPPREGRAATHRYLNEHCDHPYAHALVDDLFDLAEAAECLRKERDALLAAGRDEGKT